MAIFYPKVIYYCCESEEWNNNLWNSIKQKTEINIINEYFRHVNISELDNYKDKEISDDLRNLKSSNEIHLPGDNQSDHRKFNFINIVIAKDIKSSNKLSALLDTIYRKSSFDEEGNVNLYIVITNTIFKVKELKVNIPQGNIGVVYLHDNWEGGLHIDDNEYKNILINTVISLIILPTKSDIINELYSTHISSNVVSINAEIMRFPDDITEKYIDNTYLKLLYEFISKVDNQIQLSSEELGVNKIDKSDIKKLEEDYFFENIKIPFWHSRKARVNYIKSRINTYNKLRIEHLSKMLNKYKGSKIWNYTSPSEIDTKLFSKLREIITSNYSLKLLLNSLSSFVKEINNEQKAENKWKFIPPSLKEISITNTPFHKTIIYIFGVLIVMSLVTWFLPLSMDLQIIPSIILLFFSSAAIIYGIYYINNKNRLLQNNIKIDKKKINDFLTENTYNYMLASRKYLNRNMTQMINKIIIILNRTLDQFDKHVNNPEYPDLKIEVEGKYSKQTIDKIDTLIKEVIPQMLTNTLENHRSQIVNNIDNVEILLASALYEFHQSDIYSEIINILYDDRYIENKFPRINKLPINDLQTGVDRKKMFIVPYNSKNKKYMDIFGEKLIQIESPIKNMWAYLNIGTIIRN